MEGITDKRIIEAVLDQVEESGSAGKVNLRETARRLGCAHTNLYNYYANRNELLWAAMEKALERLMGFTQARREKEQGFRNFLESQLEFALEHPALYTLIWTDRLEGNPPVSLQELSRRASEGYSREVMDGKGKGLSTKEQNRIAGLIHDAMHGRCLKLISGRVNGDKKKKVIAETADDLVLLRKSLIIQIRRK